MEARSLLLPLGLAVLATVSSAEAVKDRKGAVLADRAHLEHDRRWIYNDFTKGFAEAKRTGKPLLVTLRCVPCLACAGIDARVLMQDLELTPLLDQFVCVRVMNANALDLSLFQVDYDLSFSTVFFNADGTVYGRYGSWTHQADSKDAQIGCQPPRPESAPVRGECGPSRGLQFHLWKHPVAWHREHFEADQVYSFIDDLWSWQEIRGSRSAIVNFNLDLGGALGTSGRLRVGVGHGDPDLRGAGRGVLVVCVKPGFVKTGMTAGLPVPPFAGEPDAVARTGLRAMARGRATVFAPPGRRMVSAGSSKLPHARHRPPAP